MLNRSDLESALQEVHRTQNATLIILENDLYRRDDAQLVNALFHSARHVIALDSLANATTAVAEVVLPAATFAESDGTLVNNESRAQRFYQVMDPQEEIQESWRWITELMRLAQHDLSGKWQTLDDVIQALSQLDPSFDALTRIAPPASFRIVGQKIPRQPHRYSGRTSMRADIDVNEPKPPDDPDAPLSFSMEGFKGQPPSALITHYWEPGWNSVQSLNKFQSEVGGPLRGGDPGQRLIEAVDGKKPTYFRDIPAAFAPRQNEYLVLPFHHIYGSEELSRCAPAVAELSPEAYLAVGPELAGKLGLGEGQPVNLILEEASLRLPVRLLTSLHPGMVGLPVGYPGIPATLPAWGKLGLDHRRGRLDAMSSWLNIFGILIGAIVAAAGLIWLERRLLGLWQDRYGPNRVGPFGLLQVVADMIKIFSKEDWIPPFADKPAFVLAPAIIMITVLLSFVVIPFAPRVGIVDLNIGLLFFLAMSSLGVYGVMLAGWSSNNKYSLMGGLRAAAQMLSYEVFMGLSLAGVVILAGSFDLRQIVEAQTKIWFFIPQILGLVIFMVAGLAETRRLPFDLPEADSELVAGFHSEYSGMKFGMFFVGEYLGITFISALIVALFFGGWLGPVLPPLVWFVLKTFVFICFFILIRAALPRPRYDQLMAYAWKVMLPLSLLNLVITGGVVLAWGAR